MSLLIASGVLPEPVHLITVFGVSNYSTQDRGDVRRISQQRRSEDIAFSKTVGCEVESWSFRDAPLRQPFSGGASYFDAALRIDPSLLARLRRRVQNWLLVRAPEIVVLPIGVGSHIDHRTVAQLRPALSKVRVLCYMDQPYFLEANLAAHGAIPPDPFWTAYATYANRGLKTSHLSHYADQPAVDYLQEVLGSCSDDQLLECVWEADT